METMTLLPFKAIHDFKLLCEIIFEFHACYCSFGTRSIWKEQVSIIVFYSKGTLEHIPFSLVLNEWSVPFVLIRNVHAHVCDISHRHAIIPELWKVKTHPS